jgi:hypothetical protein
MGKVANFISLSRQTLLIRSLLRPIDRRNGQTVLGRIVVHDRARVESEILPKYFNHASFASLRRQLNYFSFTRIGKGRQRGATYCNEAVVDLNDILRLKRRAVGAVTFHNQEEGPILVASNFVPEGLDDGSVSERAKGHLLNSVVPVVHLPSKKIRHLSRDPFKAKKSRTFKSHAPIISPYSTSPVHNSFDDEDQPQPRITLDLTVPSSLHQSFDSYHGHYHIADTTINTVQDRDFTSGDSRDEEILAGCSALLSFSSGATNFPLTGYTSGC